MRGTAIFRLFTALQQRITPAHAGNSFPASVFIPPVRITPAHAGNRQTAKEFLRANEDHPRACGEQALGHGLGGRLGGSPPRMRGTVTPYR